MEIKPKRRKKNLSKINYIHTKEREKIYEVFIEHKMWILCDMDWFQVVIYSYFFFSRVFLIFFFLIFLPIQLFLPESDHLVRGVGFEGPSL